MSRWLKRVGFAFIGVFCLQSIASWAQAPATEWKATVKITNGTCGDGVVFDIVEKPGMLTWSIKPAGGGQPVSRDMPLAPDGSGKFAFKSDTFGQMTAEVPAGKGKRPLTFKQVNGVCQWVWN